MLDALLSYGKLYFQRRSVESHFELFVGRESLFCATSPTGVSGGYSSSLLPCLLFLVDASGKMEELWKSTNDILRASEVG